MTQESDMLINMCTCELPHTHTRVEEIDQSIGVNLLSHTHKVYTLMMQVSRGLGTTGCLGIQYRGGCNYSVCHML